MHDVTTTLNALLMAVCTACRSRAPKEYNQSRVRVTNVEQGRGAVTPAFSFLALLTASMVAAGPVASAQGLGSATERPVEIVPSGGARTGKPAFTPDGRYMALAFGNGAQLWDVSSQRLIRVFKGLGSISTAVAISPDGRRIAAGAGEVLNVWNLETGEVEVSFDLKLSSANVIAFSKDGQQLVYGGSPKNTLKTPSLYIRDIADGKIVKAYVGWGVSALDISPDGKLIAFGDQSAIKILDQNGAQVRTLPGHRSGGSYNVVSQLAFSPDGKILASGGNDGSAKLWDPMSGRLVHTLPGHRGTMNMVYSLSWSPDGATLATTDLETLRLFDTRTGRQQAGRAYPSLSGRNFISTASYMPDGRALLTDANGVGLISPETLDPVGRFGFGGYIEIVKQTGSPDNVMIALNYPRRIFSLDVTTGVTSTIFEESSNQRGSWRRMSISQDRTTIVALDGDSKSLITVKDGTVRHLQRGLESAYYAGVSPDGRLAAVTGPKRVSLVDTRSGAVIRSLVGNSYGPGELAFTADGLAVVTSWQGDTQVRVHTVSTGASSPPVKFQTLGGLVPSPNGTAFLALGTHFDAYTVEHYSTVGPRLLGRMSLPKENHMVSVGDFHPDGRLAVLGGFDGMLRIWDFSTGRLVRTLAGHNGPINQVKYLARGRRIISTDSAGMKIWDAESGALLVTYVYGSATEWLAITPEGFFDATGDTDHMLSIVRGLQSFSIDQFYGQLYRPDLVKQKLAGDPEGKVRQAAERLDLSAAVASGNSPAVRIVSPSASARLSTEQVAVEVEVRDRGGGMGKVEWRLNGTTVAVQSIPPSGAASSSISDTVWLVPGENVIEVVAHNAQGLITSEPARVSVTSTSAASSAPRLHVVAVGVNDYWDSALRLNFAVPDAKAISEGFKLAAGDLYDSVEITTVLDTQATRVNLDRVFSDLSRKVRPQDVFVFFMSGHGKTIDGRFYFIPQDFRYEGETSIVGRAIGQDQLQTWFARLKAQKSILLFDACESGALIGERIAMRGMENKTAVDLLTRAIGRTVLTATTDDKPAAEGYRGHGVFTYSLLSALGGADANSDGMVDVLEIANFVDRNVPDLTFDAWKMRQVPQMKIVGSNFPLLNRMDLLPAQQDASSSFPTAPTHVVIEPTIVRQAPDANATGVSELRVGTQVRVIEVDHDWALVARGGYKIGFVRPGSIILLQ